MESVLWSTASEASVSVEPAAETSPPALSTRVALEDSSEANISAVCAPERNWSEMDSTRVWSSVTAVRVSSESSTSVSEDASDTVISPSVSEKTSDICVETSSAPCPVILGARALSFSLV